MPRYLKLDECHALLPDLDRALRDALHYRTEYRHADAELDSSLRRIRVSGGARIDRGAYLAARARRDSSGAALRDALERIEKTGALVKDLDIGLIDFLTLYQGQEVCICWKLGEEKIGWWHGVQEGFRGRKPIDEDFIRHHGPDAADAPN